MTELVDRESRNRLLDELKTAVDEWYDAEERKIQYEIDLMKSVLRGRTGSERLERAASREAAYLAFADLSSFLGGGSGS